MNPTPSLRTGFAYEAEAQRRVAHARTQLARAMDTYEKTHLMLHRMRVVDAREHVLDQLAWAEEFEVRGAAL